MKISIDTKTGIIKRQGKEFKDLEPYRQHEVIMELEKILGDNKPLSDYDIDSMWMSYRYCIGRHTIASHMRAADIWKHVKGKLSKERLLFNAFDINREIEMQLSFLKPYFHFPITSLNRIYTSAVDIVLQFMEDYDIKSVEDFIKYRDVYIKLYDNERGYAIETVTWEEWLRPQVLKIMQQFYNNDAMSEDYAWNHFQKWLNNEDDLSIVYPVLNNELGELTKDMPDKDRYYFNDLEDLFVWNDLVHCFDYEHHHKSILTNDEEVEWFWSWSDNTEEREPGKFYKSFGYHKIRVPVNSWNGSYSPYIPEENIKEDLY